MNNMILNETYELLKKMNAVKNESEFSREWLGKSESYIRMLRFGNKEASNSCIAVCGSKLAHYGNRMIETKEYKNLGRQFLKLSEQCSKLINERAEAAWLRKVV
jgi:predicted CopG family antitoxin